MARLLAAIWRGNGLVDELPSEGCLLRRDALLSRESRAGLSRTYSRLSLKEVDLGFAGRHSAANGVHTAIHALHPGDPLEIAPNGQRLELRNLAGQVVGRLAKAYSTPSGQHCVEVHVAAIVTRRREDSDADYRDSVKCDQWEVVVPDLVFDVD